MSLTSVGDEQNNRIPEGHSLFEIDLYVCESCPHLVAS